MEHGAFLNGRFEEGEQLFMYVPKGFDKYYPRVFYEKGGSKRDPFGRGLDLVPPAVVTHLES